MVQTGDFDDIGFFVYENMASYIDNKLNAVAGVFVVSLLLSLILPKEKHTADHSD